MKSVFSRSGDEKSEPGSGKEGFEPLKNVSTEALGYFSNQNNTAYILVQKDKIIYNEYESKDNRKEYNKMIRTVISEDANDSFINILRQTVVRSEIIGANDGFVYDRENDTWKSGNKIKNINIQDQCWSRTNFQLSKDAMYILVVGDTGVGKSSLIQLLTHCCGIASSNSAKSCTMDTTFYALLEKDICFIDTRGLEDSDEKTNDEEILNDIRSKMHDFNGSLCKIVWIVRESRRESKHLRAQLSFIKELGSHINEETAATSEEKNSGSNQRWDSKENDSGLTGSPGGAAPTTQTIWDSVLMIVSEPRPMKSLSEQIQGIESLAREYNCPSNHWKVGKNLIGYLNLDWLPKMETSKKKKKLKKLQMLSDSESDEDEGGPSHHGNELHYYNSKEVKSFVKNNLKKCIMPYEILCLKYKCVNCGIIGNPAFVKQLRCHKKPEKYHLEPARNIEYTHIGKTYSDHNGNLELYHEEQLVTRHHPEKEKTKFKHKSNSVFSTGGKWAIGGVVGLVTAGAIVGGVFTGGAIAGAAAASAAAAATVTGEVAVVTMSTAAAGAIGGSVGGVAVGGITGAIGGLTNGVGKLLTKCGYDGCGLYPCCGGNLNSKGCFEYYSCCKEKIGTRGCVELPQREQYYPCCQDGRGSPGCKKRYSCCKEAEGSDGCIKKCNVCAEGMENKTTKCGFKMKCCKTSGLVKNRNDARDGCNTRCEECHKQWGEPLSRNDKYWNEKHIPRPEREQGCTFDRQHVMKAI